MTISTWNVNSVKARLPNVLEYLKEYQPDVVLLQELKCQTPDFPRIEFEELGYNLSIHGQKTYNGVAIISKFKVEDVITGIPNYADENSRYIEGYFVLNGKTIRVASVYVPNGMDVNSEKFGYKKQFLDALKNHLQKINKYDELVIIGGDYNVANEDIDVYDPKSMRGQVCFHSDEQRKFNEILNCGYFDMFRKQNGDKQQFSWWDYRGGAWQYNKGMRIDYILTNPLAADHAVKTEIITTPRGKEKASDHTPVVTTFEV
ncbi:MAG TPA: exodeoxyribonuclease III [Alphaproteobacteria bacterium]|nr:exodeoxyribonuclease III [Alphaproteobacteria bacterium]